jgi:UDP-glucose 4-epimerase
MFDLLEKLRRDPHHLEVIGTGHQVRDYNYVADTVQAILLVGAHPEASGKVFNIAGGRPTTVRELVDLIIDLVGIDRPEITYTMESWPGDVLQMMANTSRLAGLGYERKVGLQAGLGNLIDWHRQEYSPPW